MIGYSKRTSLVINAIAVGGMIAMGKTTLVKGLANRLKGAKVRHELEDDPLLESMLAARYANRLTPDVLQLYFLDKRSQEYRELVESSKSDDLIILDRTVIEDRVFAYVSMSHLASQFRYYEALWNDMMNEVLYVLGVPKAYIMLHGSFETFKLFIFKRNRESEIANWNENEAYFKKLYDVYRVYMQATCRSLGINLIEISVDGLSAEEVLETALKRISEIPDLSGHRG